MIRKRKHRRPRILTPPANPNAAVISVMVRYSTDLNKLREIAFYIYFPSETIAESAREEMLADGFSVDSSPPLSHRSDWLCLATKQMKAVEDELTLLRRYFTRLAKKYGGMYDGWETAL